MLITLTVNVKVDQVAAPHHNRIAQLSLCNTFLELFRNRQKAGPHSLHEEYPLLFRGAGQRAQLGCVAGYRLLDKDVLLGKKGGVCVAVVKCMGCAYK
jgi:hypothetical protein